MYYMSIINFSCGFDMPNCMFLTGSINFHSWVTAKFSCDITWLYTVNYYIRKQILYSARQIDQQRKVSSTNR